MTNYKKICVLNFITITVGDSLYLLPLLQKLKKTYPSSKITLTGSEITKQVIGDEKSINEYITIQNLERLDKKTSKIKKIFLFKQIFFSTLKKIKRKNFDLAIVLLPNFFPYQTLPWLARIPERIGFTYPNSLFSFLLTKKTPFRNPYTTKDIVHLSDENLDILKLLDIKITKDDTLLKRNVTKEEAKKAKKILKKLKKPFYAFQPCAKHKNRQWPPSGFVEIGKKILKEKKGTILLIGSPKEKIILEKIREKIGNGCINLAGKTSIDVLAAVLRECKIVIGNDSGIMHLAASVGAQTAVLFGSSNPNHSKPKGEKEAIIIKAKSWHENAIFEKENKNVVSNYLLDISPEFVWKKIEKHL